MKRSIRDPLIAAGFLAARPKCIPVGRSRGAKALGVRYEAALARAMPWARRGQWWEFRDAAGPGYCQTDFHWQTEDGLIVIAEVKRTWKAEALVELSRLYEPVVALATGKPVLSLVICRNLAPGVRHVFGNLREALIFARSSETSIPTFQWLGKAAIQSPFEQPILKRRILNGEAFRART